MYISKKLEIGIMSLILIASSACTNSNKDKNAIATNPPNNLNNIVGSAAIKLFDPNNNLIFSDGNSSTVLKLTSGVKYNLHVDTTNVPTGTMFNLASTNIDVINGATVNSPLKVGDNVFLVTTPGDYSMKLAVASSPVTNLTVSTRIYQAVLTCANPNFTFNSLNPNSISVTPGSGSNLYNLSSSGVTTEANGTAPYLCAWDSNGVGIADTAFSDCNSPVTNIYTNYVGTRNVGLIVKDACNTTYSVQKSLALNYSIPSMPGNVFIYGQTSGSTGTALNDARVNNVTYLATNSGGNNIVQPNYGQGMFTIIALQNYGLPSSVKFAMQLQLNGLTDNLNISTMTGTVDASKAVMSKIIYSTDQAGDSNPAVGLVGTNCSLSNQGSKVLFTQGEPCSAGQTGDNNKATVEVWGNYSCTGLADAGGTINIQGSFDGYANLIDNCSGGGGGGGGIVPIQL